MTEDQHVEVQTLGMMRAAYRVAEDAVPKDPAVRAQWLEVLKLLNRAVLAQWAVTDKYAVSESDKSISTGE